MLRFEKDSLKSREIWVETILPTVLRFLLAVIFLSSGIEKFLHPEAFHEALTNYHILMNDQVVRFFDILVPGLEVLSGVYLLAGLFIRFASVLAGLLLAGFSGAVLLVLLRGESPDCGCFLFGMHDKVTWALFFRDILLMLGSAYLAWRPGLPWSIDTSLTGPQMSPVSAKATEKPSALEVRKKDYKQ